jgi:hypothetical protein
MTSTKRRDWITAEELTKQLANDPEYQQRVKERDERLKKLRDSRILDEAPVVADLKAVGIFVDAPSELCQWTEDYSRAYPVLLKHLRLPHEDYIQGWLARPFARKNARQDYWPEIVKLFRETPADKSRDNMKQGLAIALCEMFCKEVFEEYLDIISDGTLGTARVLMLQPLRRSKDARVQSLIDRLANDPDMKNEIGSWRERKKRS